MDLKQRKLNKSEWDSIEIPVSKSEIDILNLIVAGFHDVNIRVNNNKSLFMYLKIDYNEKIEEFVYNKYFRERVIAIEEEIIKIHPKYKKINVDGIVRLNSADKIRMERNDEEAIKNSDVYENTLLTYIIKMLETRREKNKKMYTFNYYTVYKLIRNNIHRLNKFIDTLTRSILDILSDEIEISDLIENGVELIEKNTNLLKYGDLLLYEHQKEIFTVFQNPGPKLILYMAPTGTGKTLTPLALSEHKRVIFVCAARHVGLQLARSAISINKKVAFAFGCASSADIRLHYFAAKEYTINKRSGGIGKVDNSVGDNVEIIICDIKSYLPAMYYMLAFNSGPQELVTYWDEPTITMDYSNHEFHETIKQNWSENLIPNIVLSSATLPKMSDLSETIPDFLNKFNKRNNANIYNIVSHDCKKSIRIINKDGYVVLPHYLSGNYSEITKIIEHCENYLTLLRYFDLKEVIEFITYVLQNNMAGKKMELNRHFESLDDINMTNIKLYYIKLLKSISSENWTFVYNYFTRIRKPRILSNETVDATGKKITKSRSLGSATSSSVFNSKSLAGSSLSRVASEQMPAPQLPVGTSGAYITTKDSYTLTDGPTIFMSNDIEKIAKFCIQQANIPTVVMDDIMKKIEYNNVINQKLVVLESVYDIEKEKIETTVKNLTGSGSASGRNKSTKDIRKFNREYDEEFSGKNLMKKITQEITELKAMIKTATLNELFVPNKKEHIEKWTTSSLNTSRAFTSDIDDNTVNDIMTLNGIEDSWKILLLMGIGVFITHENIRYTEIMKKMADEQKLYMIIASSDYIYGTNYQFCHGYLSKDLDLTQEKIIQGMGRIGRNNIQQTYTVRFRDDAQIAKLFTSDTEKPEIINMNKLFNCNNVKYEDNKYVRIVEEEETNDA
jgi:hypothetical protein